MAPRKHRLRRPFLGNIAPWHTLRPAVVPPLFADQVRCSEREPEPAYSWREAISCHGLMQAAAIVRGWACSRDIFRINSRARTYGLRPVDKLVSG
jgi:hypothetical protein